MKYLFVLLLAGCGAADYNPCLDILNSGVKPPVECVSFTQSAK